MKTLSFIMIVILSPLSLLAQRDVYDYKGVKGLYLKKFNHYQHKNSNTSFYGDAYYRSNHVKSLKQIDYFESNKNQPSYSITDYDSEGRKKAFIRFTKDDSISQKSEFKYHVNGKISTIKITNYKGEIATQNFEYDKNTNVTSISYTNYKHQSMTSSLKYNEFDKLIFREDVDMKGNYLAYKIGYNLKGKLTSKSIFEKDSINPKKLLLYDYYENGDDKTITYYIKGKLKYAWHYDCKPEGELINIKNKDNSTICIKEEHDSTGNRILWERTFDEKGHLVKKKYTYSKDSTLLSTQYFNNSDDYLYFERKTKTEGGHIEILYNRNGTQQIWSESFLNKNRKLTKCQYLTGKQKTISLYHYEGDLKTSSIDINRHGKTVTEFIYTFY